MNFFYESSGTGESLLLIPGFASGAWNWFKQADLANNFQLITFDPRGIGKSSLNGQILSMNVFVEDIISILDDLKIEKASILGASFGGFVAQEFALKFPHRLNKLVLTCTSAGGINHVKPSLEILRAFSLDPTLTVGERIRRFIRPAFTDEFNENHADEVEKICRMRESSEVNDLVYMAQLQAAFTFDNEKNLDKITAPTLVITGDQDQVVPMQNSVNLAEKLPNAELEFFENGSHLFFVEQSEKFNEIVKNFLNKT